MNIEHISRLPGCGVEMTGIRLSSIYYKILAGDLSVSGYQAFKFEFTSRHLAPAFAIPSSAGRENGASPPPAGGLGVTHYLCSPFGESGHLLPTAENVSY